MSENFAAQVAKDLQGLTRIDVTLMGERAFDNE